LVYNERYVEMRRFQLHREEDVSGVSGLGIVAEGVMFGDKSCAMRWRTKYKSTAVYERFDDLHHIHTHNGSTRIVWVDMLD